MPFVFARKVRLEGLFCSKLFRTLLLNIPKYILLLLATCATYSQILSNFFQHRYLILLLAVALCCDSCWLTLKGCYSVHLLSRSSKQSVYPISTVLVTYTIKLIGASLQAPLAAAILSPLLAPKFCLWMGVRLRRLFVL